MRKAGKLAVAGTLLHEEITQLGQFGKRLNTFGLSLLPHIGKTRPLHPVVMINQNFKFQNPESHVILITKS